MELKMTVHGSTYYSGNLDVSREDRVYKFKDSPLVISYASTTEETLPQPRYKLEGTIKYYDGEAYKGVVQINDGFYSFEQEIASGSFIFE